MDLGGGVTIYGVIIDPIVEGLSGQGGDPEGNPDAEATIDTIAHETVEAITDPTGTGWVDPDGYEVGDKCETGPQVGNPLGYAANGSPYDQLIGGHEYLIQEMWSNDDGGCVQHTTQTTSPLPLPEIDMTQFSSTVSGNIGANTAGVTVTVAVYRERRGSAATTPSGSNATTPTSSGTTTPRIELAAKVTQASATTGPTGAWSLSLARFAVGDDRDLVTVTYAGATLQPDFITTGSGGSPFEEGGWTGWTDLDNGDDVTNRNGGFVTVGPCFQAGVLTVDFNGTPYSANDPCNAQTDTATIATGPISPGAAVTLSSLDNRAFTQPQPIGPSLDPQGNEAGALVKLTVKLGEPGAQSTFSSPLADVLPLARLTGFATCTADLQFGAAECTGLVPGERYRLTRARGADTLSKRAGQQGVIVVGPFRGAPALRGGDVLTLSNGQVVLTTLHVAHLAAVVEGEETVLAPGSRCQPGLYYGAPPSKPAPASTVAGLTGQNGATLTGRICPASGSAAGFSATAIAQADDLSGGLTQTEVADISSTSPLAGETLYGRFTARAQAAFLGPNDEVIPSPYPVSVAIIRAGATKPSVILVDVNTAAGTPIKSLKPGSYDAIWTWHDFNGDARTVVTDFVEEPANGSAGSGSAPAKQSVKSQKVDGPRQSGVRNPVSFTINLRLALPELGRSDATPTPLALG
jgi:hypothetical protein